MVNMLDTTMNDERIAEMAVRPLADTEATQMLAAGMQRVQAQTGKTQRELASELGYKTSVVLSHMALGRVPIPVDKASDIARVLGLDPMRFLLATLKQRHPGVAFEALLGVRFSSESALAAELTSIAGLSLDELGEQTKHVLREVVASAQPTKRWLSVAEIAAVELLRELFPRVQTEGLAPGDRDFLRTLAALLNETNEKAESDYDERS